jgi:hypothetical protein
MFSTRPQRNDETRANVVYQFVCPEDGCNASYVGYTTCTLKRRSGQHRYNPSSIHKHFVEDHSTAVPPINNIVAHFNILYSSSCKLELKIAEAIHIKQRNPFINVKYNEMSNYFNLFK